MQLLLLLAIAPAAAQETVVYLTDDLTITKNKAEAFYSARVTKVNGQWDCAVYYGGNQGLAFNGTFKDRNLTIRNGWFTFYYPVNRRMMSSGRFDDNIPVDVWQSWYENGAKKDSGELHEGKKKGLWKEWRPNGQLRNMGHYIFNFRQNGMPPQAGSRSERRMAIYLWLVNQPSIKDGLWLTWHENGQLQDSVQYQNGLREGVYRAWHPNGMPEAEGIYYSGREALVWRWYYSNGLPRTEETYENGKIKSMKCFDSTGTYTGDFCSVNKAAYFKNGGPAGFEEYLKKEMRLPDMRLPYEGRMVVNFIINKNGVAENIIIEDAPYLAFEMEVQRVLSQMPAWDPAVFHNLTVSYEISLVFPYSPKGMRFPDDILRFPSDTQLYHDLPSIPFLAPVNDGW